MAGAADLVIRILADTSGAQSNVNALISTLGKAAGVGAGAGVAGGMVAASMQVQDAMARVQTAYNNTDFTPGTARYQAAQEAILKFSTTTATSFTDAAAVYAQGARYINEAGQRLDPTQLDAYTDTMLRLSKVSSDQLSPVDIGQRVDILSKLFGTSDFATIGSEISGLSGMHNHGEGPGLDAAIAIGQVGADIGVSQEQALAVGNYMADLGLGGQMGGSSIGRLLQRTNIAADTTLDPEQQYGDVKKQRDASEKLSDMQSQLAIAEQRRDQMYGQHGLKTAYRRDPAAVMSSDQEIAKLQREISDQQTDMSHMGDAKPASAGSANISAMADLLGEDKTSFAQQFQSDPMGALLQWTHALSQLPEDQRMSAMTKAYAGRTGAVNVRDLKIIEALANPDRQGSLESYLAEATGQSSSPTDLATRSDIPLSTTTSKVTDVANTLFGQAAAAGSGPRQAIDAGATDLLKAYSDNTDAITKLDNDLTGNPMLGMITTGVVAGVTTALPIIATRVLLGGGARAGASAAVSGAASTAAGNGAIGTAVGGGGFLDVAGPALALAAPFLLADAFKNAHGNDLNVPVDDSGRAYEERHPIGAIPASTSPQQINVGGITLNVPATVTGWEAIKADALKDIGDHLQAAWVAAQQGTPVAGAMGGQYTSGSSPR